MIRAAARTAARRAVLQSGMLQALPRTGARSRQATRLAGPSGCYAATLCDLWLSNALNSVANGHATVLLCSGAIVSGYCWSWVRMRKLRFEQGVFRAFISHRTP